MEPHNLGSDPVSDPAPNRPTSPPAPEPSPSAPPAAQPSPLQPPLPPPPPTPPAPLPPPAAPSATSAPSASSDSPPSAGLGGQIISGGFSPPPNSMPTPVVGTGPAVVPPAGVVVGGGGLTPPPAAAPPSARKRSFKPFLIALVALLVIGGGSAAAYFGIVVPNQPSNVLKTALINSLQQTQVSANGSFEVSPATDSGVAYKGTISSASDTVAKTADLQVTLTVSGISFPVETRLVNKSFYVKVGDLGTVASLAQAFSPDAGSFVQSISKDISNKWIVVDSTLLEEDPTIKCVLNTSWTLSAADIKLLENQYGKHPFTDITKASADTIDGKPAEKFLISIDDDKGAAYFDSTLSNLSVIKNLQKCPGASSTGSTSTKSSLADHDKTPLTIWVDKASKRIVQITSNSTAQDSRKLNLSGSATLKFSYGHVSITAPADAEPAVQVWADIVNSAKSNPALSNLLNGSDATGSDSSNGIKLLQ